MAARCLASSTMQRKDVGRHRFELDVAGNLRRDEHDAFFVGKVRPGLNEAGRMISCAVEQQDRGRGAAMGWGIQQVLIIRTFALHGS